MERIYTPKVIEHSAVGIWVSIIAIIMTLLLVTLQKWVIKKTNSVAIGADALHYQSDLLLNLGVLVALFLSQGTWLYADGIFTVGVGLFLIFGAAKIAWLSIDHLMDKELHHQELDTIKSIILNHDEALGIHELRTRKAGALRFIQFHLELDDSLLLIDAHRIGDAIEQEIKAQFSPCEVFIHHDPSSVVPAELSGVEMP